MLNQPPSLSLPPFDKTEDVHQGMALKCDSCGQCDRLQVRATEGSVTITCSTFENPPCEWRVVFLSLPALECSNPEYRLFSYIGSPDVRVIGKRLIHVEGQDVSFPIDVVPHEPRLQMLVSTQVFDTEGEQPF